MHFRSGRLPARYVPALLLLLPACSSGSSTIPPPAGLTYGAAASVYPTCAEITANVPTVGSGTVTSYVVLPALPAGLALDTTTGVISGTPSEPLAATIYTVTAANETGSTTFDVSIQVDSTLVTGIGYGGAPLAQLVDFPGSWTPTTTSGTSSAWSVSSGTLPTGLTLDASTGAITGTPTVPGTTTVTISATNCEPAPSTVDVVFELAPWFESSMYVTNNRGGYDSTVSSALWDEALGGLRPTGNSPGMGYRITSPTLHPDGTTLYVVDDGIYGIQQLELDAVHGRIAESTTGTQMGLLPSDIAISPNGAFLYAAGTDSNLYQFAVDPETHALSALTPAFVGQGVPISRMAMHPSGAWLVVVGANDGFIESLAVDAVTGLVASGGQGAAIAHPESVTIAPSGRHAYVSDPGTDTVHAFAIDANDGGLAETGYYSTAAAPGCFDIVFHPTGAHAYVASANASRVLQYDVDVESGALTPMGVDGVELEATARGIAVDPRGERLYVTMTNDRIRVYAIGGDGSLSPAANSLIGMRAGATDIVFTKAPVPHALASESLYALARDTGSVSDLAVSGGMLQEQASMYCGGHDNARLSMLWMTGRMYEMRPRFPFGHNFSGRYSFSETQSLTCDGLLFQQFSPHAFVVGASERSAYAITGQGIFHTRFDSEGYWQFGSVYPIEGLADDAAIHPGGEWMYVPEPYANRISTFSLASSSGNLSPLYTTSTWNEPVETLVTPSGRFVYAVCREASLIEAFSVEMTNGELTTISSHPLQFFEVDAALSPDGRFLAVAAELGVVTIFAIGTDSGDAVADGQLTEVFSTSTIGPLATIEFDSSGTYLYAGLPNSGIQTFQVLADGSLDSLGVTPVFGIVSDIALRLAVR